jgi:hypothetical protein
MRQQQIPTPIRSFIGWNQDSTYERTESFIANALLFVLSICIIENECTHRLPAIPLIHPHPRLHHRRLLHNDLRGD